MTKREALREARKLWPDAQAEKRKTSIRPYRIFRLVPATLSVELGAGRN